MDMHRRTLLTLYGANLLTAIGVWFFLPLLPIFLGRKGGSAALVGAVFAAGLLANGAIRYPAGWAADRFGTRPVTVIAMASYALLFLAYLLPLPTPAFIVLRFVHGGAGGAFWPAANGLLDDYFESWFLSFAEAPRAPPEGLESVVNLGLSQEWLAPPRAVGESSPAAATWARKGAS